MGLRLAREVQQHAPADLTPVERAVLLNIALDANERTRIAVPGIKALAQQTGLTKRGLAAIFERLAERGIEVRMITGTDHRGNPVVANKGHRARYRVPNFAPPKGAPPCTL